MDQQLQLRLRRRVKNAQCNGSTWYAYESSLQSPSLTTISTDASVTPTTVHVSLSGTSNAVRIYSGETLGTEPFYYLYVSINGGSVKKIKITRWQARIIKASVNATFSFGTSDGRQIQVSSITTPNALPSITGTTASIAIDDAGPPLWTPLNPHVQVPVGAYGFQIASDGVERDIFLSEYISNTWTKQWHVVLPVSGGVKIFTNGNPVALACYGGATLTINANIGASISGASNQMNLAYSVTGTTHNVTNISQFNTAVAAAVSGDEIVLAAGTYALVSLLSYASFSANIALGNHGCEGITIRGATGTASDVVITSQSWNIVDNGGTTGSLMTNIRDLTIDLTGVASGVAKFSYGKYQLQNVTVKGPQSSGNDLLEIDALDDTKVTQVTLLRCNVNNSYGDCLSTNGKTGTNTIHASTFCYVVNSSMSVAGGTSNDQTFTAHNGYTTQLYGCSFSDANTNAIANDSVSTSNHFFCSITPGTRKSGVLGANLYGCRWQPHPNFAGTSTMCRDYFMRNYVTFVGYSSTTIFINDPVFTIQSNRMIYVSGSVRPDGIAQTRNPSGGTTISANLIDGLRIAFQEATYNTGTGNAIYYINNFLRNCTTRGFDFTIGQFPLYNYNNVSADGTVNPININATAMGSLTTNYNRYKASSIDADLVPGANDVANNVAADISSIGMPTASGNCDGTGGTSVISFDAGDSDAWGLVLYYGGRASIGNREIPGVYSNAVLFPDIWI